MIESFGEFNKRTSNSILEEVTPIVENTMDGDVVLDSKDEEKLRKSGEPDIETVSDNGVLSKMTMLVIKKLRKNIDDKFYVYPYVLEIDGKKCSLICSGSKTKFFAIYREGINKVITYFTENPINASNAFSKFSVSTSKYGILKAVETLIAILISDSDDRLNEEVTSPVPYSAIPWPTYYKRLYNDSAETDNIPQDQMAQFITLYNELSDNEIANKIKDLTEDSEYLESIRNIVGKKADGSIDYVQAMRFTVFIHFVICGTPGIAPETIAKKMPNLWFWGAGKSGEIAVTPIEGKGYVVKDSQALIEKKVDELQDKMDSVYDAADAICKYIKSGGKDTSMRREIAHHRGMLITGAAGIGKSVALDNAIKDNGLVKGVHYKNMANATTSARETYKELYEHNNMLLVYDDTPEMFNTEQKISLWKLAMEKDENKRWVVSPDGEVRGKSDVYYATQKPGVTRQECYFREVGKMTPYEREKWLKKKESDIREYYRRKKAAYRGSTDYDWSSEETESSIKATAIKDFEKFEKENVNVLIPDGFIFNGIIVYITNQSLSTFMKTVKDHWDAIHSRMETIDISPTQKTVWYWLRRKIVRDMNDDSIPNDLKMLPTESPDIPDYDLNEVLKFIDDIIDGKYNTQTEMYGKINWRSVSNFREYLFLGQRRWKQKILESMKVDAIRDSGKK